MFKYIFSYTGIIAAHIYLYVTLILSIFFSPASLPYAYALEADSNGSNNIALPYLGDRASGIVSLKKEHEIGKTLQRKLYKQLRIMNDPVIQSYLENRINKLADASALSSSSSQFSILLIDDENLNAFAAPGGVIGVNTGLFLYAKNEQELLAVLAHELAHLSQRHFARNLEDAKNNRIPTIAAMLGSILLAATTGGAGMAAMASTMAGMASHQLSFSRQQEAEADRTGIAILFNAGINPHAMPDMFQHLQDFQDSGEQLAFLQSHPVTLKRISDTYSRARLYPQRHYRPDDTAFKIMRMRIQLHNGLPREHGRDIETRIKGEKNNASDIDYYGLALSHFRNKKFAAATDILRRLIKKNPGNLYFQLLNIRAVYAKGNQKEALEHAQKLMHDYPNNLPVTMLYAELLYEAGDYKKCQLILRFFLENDPENAFGWKLLSNASGKTGRHAYYYMDNSRYLHLTGDTNEAIEQLQYALNNLRMTYTQREAMRQLLIAVQKDRQFEAELSL